MKKKIVFIISNINKALAFEWIAEYLSKKEFNVNFILLNPGDSELEKYLIENNIPVYRVKYNGKKDILKAVFSIYKFLKSNKPDIIHTHLFDANITGLIAGWLAGVKKRIYTRHHSDYHHIYYPKAVKYDKLVNRLSTNIVAISKVVENILITKENVSSSKIELIHHGFKLHEYSNPSVDHVRDLRGKYNPDCTYPVIGVISRYTEWKGVQYIIPAFEKLLTSYPDALLILANSNGDYKIEIQTLLNKIPKKNYVEIEFEKDIFSLYKLFDVFVHVPISPDAEAFGQTYIECLAAGVPMVSTKSGIAHEILIDEYNSLIVPYKDSNAIYDSIISVITNQQQREQMTANSLSSVSEKFDLKLMIHKLETLYLK